ncbi:GIY-YIG nuclease family protein [Kangiella shandongensis]|uniref:GIY-YIG nuclease family protein n=1 Tax=Kangiella shandongensis TaxID=2763258 RepID=UPI001CBCF380|nr:GIY-YIG nuclease family protein [Kangiella shandongensis]
MEKQGYVYILALKPNGVLYIGVTSNLVKRIWEHKQGEAEGFTNKYNVKQLVYYEACDSIESAIFREKRLKKWNRNWKVRLIEKQNQHWKDLYLDLLD